MVYENYQGASVYVETTIVSYLASRPSRDIVIAANQELTRQWWEEEHRHLQLFISPFVYEEATKGDPLAIEKRLDVLRQIQMLARKPHEIGPLTEKIHSSLKMPLKAKADAIHLAYAIIYRLDYLLSWNCTHLANAITCRRLTNFCQSESLWLPIICTPAEMVEEKKGLDDVY
jgi:hypothetical protein